MAMIDFTKLVPKPTMLEPFHLTYIKDNQTPAINAINANAYSSGLERAGLANSLVEDYNKKFKEAKNANEARYNEILQGFGGITGDINTAFEGLSNQGQQDIAQQTLNSKAANTQALVNSGMVGTTILPSLNMQADKNSIAALNRLRDSIAMSKLAYQTGNEKDKLAFMERREDTYPDAAMFTQLLQQFGNFSDVQYTYK
jgi:hypothetical protein